MRIYTTSMIIMFFNDYFLFHIKFLLETHNSAFQYQPRFIILIKPLMSIVKTIRMRDK